MSDTRTPTPLQNKQQICVLDLISQIENLNKNQMEKEEFIKNYAKVKDHIEFVDGYLNLTDSDEQSHINNLSIQELYGILENYSQQILNPEKLNVMELKYLLEISNLLDEKINNEKLYVIENK